MGIEDKKTGRPVYPVENLPEDMGTKKNKPKSKKVQPVHPFVTPSNPRQKKKEPNPNDGSNLKQRIEEAEKNLPPTKTHKPKGRDGLYNPTSSGHHEESFI